MKVPFKDIPQGEEPPRQENWTTGTRLTMASQHLLIESVIQALEQFLALHKCYVPRLSLVLTELLRNAVTHGNDADPSKTVEVTADISTPGALQVYVLDQGGGFDWRAVNLELPESPRPVGQRGLALVASCVNELTFNGSGNAVMVCMKCESEGCASISESAGGESPRRDDIDFSQLRGRG